MTNGCEILFQAALQNVMLIASGCDQGNKEPLDGDLNTVGDVLGNAGGENGSECADGNLVSNDNPDMAPGNSVNSNGRSRNVD